MLEKIVFTRAVNISRLPYSSILNIPSPLVSAGHIPPYTPLRVKPDIAIHHMTKQHLRLAISWAKEEGWIPGIHEVEALYAADPKGYFMLEVNGEPAASLSAVRHSPHFAFLGLFIVPTKLRGNGYGAILWDAVMHNLKSYSSIGLSGVMAQVDRYKKSGFRPTFFNMRWRGKSVHIPKEGNFRDTSIFLRDRFSAEALIKYDGKIFSTPRAAFLTEWLKMPESHALAAFDMQNNICGYGVISRTVDGYKIAPLFANSEMVAEQLYRGLSRFVGENESIHIDICETNPYAHTLMERFGLEGISSTLQMYKGKVPEIEHHKIVGLTSLEIG